MSTAGGAFASTLASDAHKAVKGLKGAGFEEAQAEAVVSATGEAMGGNVATREHVTAEIAAGAAPFQQDGSRSLDFMQLPGSYFRKPSEPA